MPVLGSEKGMSNPIGIMDGLFAISCLIQCWFFSSSLIESTALLTLEMTLPDHCKVR